MKVENTKRYGDWGGALSKLSFIKDSGSKLHWVIQAEKKDKSVEKTD